MTPAEAAIIDQACAILRRCAVETGVMFVDFCVIAESVTIMGLVDGGDLIWRAYAREHPSAALAEAWERNKVEVER